MRKFLVNVNGVSYEVEVEEMNANEVAASKSAATAPKAEPKAEEKSAPKATGKGVKVDAPMPGTIKKVLVKNGDTVKKGSVLFILEAMKLENEIMSPVDGTITSVGTSEGASVNPGETLCTIA